MRVLVCGGRDFASAYTVFTTLYEINEDRGPIECVIHGGATGADTDAGAWAAENGIKVAAFRAEWDRHGRAAGPLRNQRMLDEGKPDLVVAFPGGKGTADMVRRARKAGVEVLEIPRKATP